MAAFSGGEQWSVSVKTLLEILHTSFNKNDLTELVKTILRSKEGILNHDEEHDNFYMCFAALSAQYLSNSANYVSKSSLSNIIKSCKILIELFLNRLQNYNEQCCLTQEELLLLINGLCRGGGLLARIDVASLTNLLEMSKPPPSSSSDSSITVDKPTEEVRDVKRARLDPCSAILDQLMTPLHEVDTKSNKTDKSDDTSELNVESALASATLGFKNLFAAKNMISLQQLNAGDVLISMCLKLPHLQPFVARYKDATEGKALVFPTTMSDAQANRSSFQSLLSNIKIVHLVLNLPILEPLHDERLETLCKVVMSCLIAAITVSVTNSILTMSTSNSSKTSASRDDDLDNCAFGIVKKSLDIFKNGSTAVHNSTRAGGHNLQNFQMIGAWCLLTGLQHTLCMSPPHATLERGKDAASKPQSQAKTPEHQSNKQVKELVSGTPSTTATGRQSLLRVQQGFGALTVGLANQALQLLVSLLEDLQVEMVLPDSSSFAIASEAPQVELDIQGRYSARQRIQKLLSCFNITNLFFNLAAISYRKACMLKRVHRHLPDETYSTSESSSCCPDDISWSGDSSGDEADDDSEPILGHWFEETVAPKEVTAAVNSSATEQQPADYPFIDAKEGPESGSLIPDKAEPHGFITLASSIFDFMNRHILNSENQLMLNYGSSSLSDQHMIILAGIIRDLDRETSRGDSGASRYGCAVNKLYENFSHAIAKYSHNLLATGALAEALQNLLLVQLGVFPGQLEDWPLQVYPRTLAIMAQIFLLRQQREKEEMKNDSEAACVLIWQRFIQMLQKRIINPIAPTVAPPPIPVAPTPSGTPGVTVGPTTSSGAPNTATAATTLADEIDDLNVEHAQLLLFLFHLLQLMQKKAILLDCARVIINVSKISQTAMNEEQLLLLSRLLLVFEYLVKNLYEAPPTLVEQIQSNLFNDHQSAHTHSLSPSPDLDKESGGGSSGSKPKKLYIPCKDIEDNYNEHCDTDDTHGSMRPRFYNLVAVDVGNQDVPKLDGFSSNFLLGTADILCYSKLYQALIDLLGVGQQWDLSLRTGDKRLSYLGLCAVQFCFTITWRLLLSLPPSVSFLQLLAVPSTESLKVTLPLSLIWIPRISHKSFATWHKDCLVRQGLTTQKAETLLRTISKNCDQVAFDVVQAKSVFQATLRKYPTREPGCLIPREHLPQLFEICLLDSVLAKLQVAFDDAFSKPTTEIDPKAQEVVADFFPDVLQLIELVTVMIRSSLLYQTNDTADPPASFSAAALAAHGLTTCLSSSRCPKATGLATSITTNMPMPLRSLLTKWNENSCPEFPAISAWRNAFANDPIPSESYVRSIQMCHVAALSSQRHFSINLSLKHTLHALVRFVGDLAIWCQDPKISSTMVDTLFPLIMNASTENLADFVTLTLERIIGTSDSDDYMERVYYQTLSVGYTLINNYSNKESGLKENIFQDILKFIESMLDKAPGRKALARFFCKESHEFSILLLSTLNKHLSASYDTKVLQLFNKLFQLADKSGGDDDTLSQLCASVSKLAKVSPASMQEWLEKMVCGPLPATTSTAAGNSGKDDNQLKENRLLLQSLVSYMVKENSHVGEEVANAILEALVFPMQTQILHAAVDGVGYPELMGVMATLAESGTGSGHVGLLKRAIFWLHLCKNQLFSKEATDSLDSIVVSGKLSPVMESVCFILSYMVDVFGALRPSSDRYSAILRCGTASPAYDGDFAALDGDSDWADELCPEEEDSAGEDSDEDSLSNKLCTFTITRKEFMNQHWYHCHTCKMVDGVGVCTTCAKVCHKDHDVTYAKFGSFFCDCGAKEDGSCTALVKRTISGVESDAMVVVGSSPFSSGSVLHSSLRRRSSSPAPHERSTSDGRRNGAGSSVPDDGLKHRQILAKQLDPLRDSIFSSVSLQKIACSVFDLLQSLEPVVGSSCYQNSPVGSNARIQESLKTLHETDKTFETCDQLMVPTLGSQEGAFENVRMTYSGDQGQTIRQLIGVHVIRRVAMCVLASSQGKRQHLAVSHEKGKITILQLSSLLKQTDSSKRKLTLTRLASAPVPFTVLSIAGNPCNEEFLAVCGLKDCHVLTFTPSGAIADHLALQPQPAIGNFIIKAVWLPGSQTELALVMPDFVKIFDLAVDVVKPNYYFLLPSSKIRDCCFAFLDDGQRHLLLMSSSGHIYTQPLCEESTAKHGPFYVTNVLEVKHPELKDSNSQIGGGGVSIYFSHALQLLFFSYAHGKSYMSPFPKMVQELDRLQVITFKTNGGGKPNNQPLCQWSEIQNHPGLVCCLTQTNNNPVILMVKPDTVLVQEIKVLPAKAKITDMVAVRHQASSGEQRTTIILLCEDGSLRIYMANVEQTNFWLTPTHQPMYVPINSRPAKKKKSTKLGGRPSGSVAFPVDFFEHSQAMSDVEFGGNDVLQIYHTQQIKHRLLTTGMYVASTKPAGFVIEVLNSDTTMVMTGVRVMVGSQDLQKAPTYMEIFNRSMPLAMTRSRWFDFPFTREESLQADKKISIFFGANSYPSGVTIIMVDSIKVYGKTKDAFGWPEDTDEFPTTSPLTAATPSNGNSSGETESAAGGAPAPRSSLDRLLAASLELLDHCFSLIPASESKTSLRPMAVGLATQLLTLPTTVTVQQQAKCLLMSLLANRVAYHNHKDQALLASVASCLKVDHEARAIDQLDVERFYNLVVTARSVAVARPHNLVRFADNLEEGLPSTTSTDEHLAIAGSQENASTSTVFSSRLALLDSSERRTFLALVMDSFWKLHDCQPCNPALAPVSQPGLCNLEVMVQALVDIMPAFATCDLDKIDLVSKLYTELLLCENPAVSFVCKQALTRALRPRYRRRRVCIPSPPTCEMEERKLSLPLARGNSCGSGSGHEEPANGADAMALLPDAAAAAASILSSSPLEALLAGHVNFQPMLDIPSDADDETMVELAIALSLQDHTGFPDHAGLQAFSLGSQARRTSSLERAQFSDTTASAGVSDDEGSTAATDGSTLRTPPAEQGGSVGSESVDSITGEHNVSGRSSANGDNIPESTTTGARSETSSVGHASSMHPDVDGCEVEAEAEIDTDTTVRLHTLRLLMLEKFLQHVPRLPALGGIRAIPFLQVIIMLATDLDCEHEKDRAILDSLLHTMISQLDITLKEADMSERSERHEVQLVIMRLLSVLMSRNKSTGSKSSSSAVIESSVYISNATAGALISSGAISYCLHVLKSLLEYWKSYHHAEDAGAATLSAATVATLASVAGNTSYGIGQLKGSLLRPRPTFPLNNMTPFFLRNYVKGHANDVFEAYPQLLTEMVLRLPYQMKKIADSSAAATAGPSSAPVSLQPPMPAPVFEQGWFYFLCEHMMTQQTPFVRKQVRKLLLFICGSKERYRQLRDLYVLESNIKEAKILCAQGGYTFQSGGGVGSNSAVAGKSGGQAKPTVAATISLPYDSLITLIEQLKASVDIASSRTSNWQLYCQTDESVLPFLLQVSYLLDEGVSPVCLQLLQCALCNVTTTSGSSGKSHRHASSSKQQQLDKEADKSNLAESGEANDDGSVTPEEEVSTHQYAALVQQVTKYVDHNVLSCFIKSFLLESNQSAVRWQAHSLLLSLFSHSTVAQQEVLLSLMWRLWPQLPSYVRKAAQFVDLLGYFAIRLPPAPGSAAAHEYVDRAIGLLREQNRILAYHPNGALYTTFQGLVEFDGYYLESEPCLVCNDPEVALANAKLSALKMDSCFTTTTQIVKLVGSHVISRIVLRVGDLKRAKMVRTVVFHYNNRSVQAVVELKNRPAMWHRARRCTLAAGQSELKVEFPLPIVACNLMIEYVDFYENVQASSETLQCPRCSASVPANPGVCANCGENVFQCHKCRAINYDEKDPFLCNTCGFCKYAKFDYTLTVKPCCAVDPIENEEDRKKAVALINTLLEKADRLYRQLLANKPFLESLLARISEHSFDGPGEEGGGLGSIAIAVANAPTTAATGSSGVNKAIQQLAQRYCSDCKSAYEELGKIIQKVLATRKELVEYDRHQKYSKVRPAGPSTPVSRESLLRALSGPSVDEPQSLSSGRCYGCASAATEHCITLLRALATNAHTRQVQCGQGLIRELVDYNLRRGSVQVCFEVRQLLCLLTRDNLSGTEELNSIIMEKVTLAIRSQLNSPDFASSVHYEMALLASSVQRNDSCWEQRLRCVLNLFLLGVNSKSPVVMETITVPCLCILQSLIRPSPPTSKKNKDKLIETLSTVKIEGTDVRIDLRKWLDGDPHHSFAQWKQRVPPVVALPAIPTSAVPASGSAPVSTAAPKKAATEGTKKEASREHFLAEKYGSRWRHRARKDVVPIKLVDSEWLRHIMFNPPSHAARLEACNMVGALCVIPTRKKEILDLLTTFLNDLGKCGESAAEFLGLYESLIKPAQWKSYLAIRNVLPLIGNLITKEISYLTMLEETTLKSDLSEGYALKMLTELLASFIEQDNIRRHYKSRLVGTVLNGYLSLRKLVIQRTKLVDDTQEKLLELLEEMTTGNEAETQAFMSVCVETVKKYPLDDFRTPVFIFERLCSMIYPEENDMGEFLVTLEKDPQQEDFLQGRMLGNPYSSNEPGLGPLMRDIKNKVCQDCELVALLEDDNGMELLVNNKIISLDLAVKEVYKRVWLSDCPEGGESMRIMYRMRGLLGDATEEFIESLDARSSEEVDAEEVYKMANWMAHCGGIEVMLERLQSLTDLKSGRPLLTVILKLFGFCAKVKTCRQALIRPELGCMRIMLAILRLALGDQCESLHGQPGGPVLIEQLLLIMETVLVEASSLTPAEYAVFTETCGNTDDIDFLLGKLGSNAVKNSQPTLLRLTRVLPFLVFASPLKLAMFVSFFEPCSNFNCFDFDHTANDDLKMECLCLIANNIECNPLGNQLKDLIVEAGIVKCALEYILHHAPPIRSALLLDSDELKEFISKPALKYILRFLTGMAHGHETTQSLVSADCIPIVHRLEQVSSDEHVGSLAENLMEALRENADATKKIEEVRRSTRAEKKRLAMAMREKQLAGLGMSTNEKGQVTAKSSMLQQMEELGEESGLVCVICREGYRFQATKVLGIYTYTKRCIAEDMENKPRKTPGYSTVTHFNVVHVDCHMSAVRLARGRDEWESAALQNANTRCNGLLPLWGPQVADSVFAGCLARHNTYLQECTGHRDIGYPSTVHDLKLLVLRFANEKSFSEDSGGGGPQSNLHLIPYVIHMALYVINTTRSAAKEDKNLNAYLDLPLEKLIENSFEADGPLYWTTLSLCVQSNDAWRRNCVKYLKKLLVLAHVRSVVPPGATRIANKQVKEYNIYKPVLIFFGIIHGLYTIVFPKVPFENADWPTALADYIRNNDQQMLEAGDKLLTLYQDELLPCQTLNEFCDVVGLLGEIPDLEKYLSDALEELPS